MNITIPLLCENHVIEGCTTKYTKEEQIKVTETPRSLSSENFQSAFI